MTTYAPIPAVEQPTADPARVRAVRVGLRRRTFSVSVGLLVVLAAAFMTSLAVGDFPLSLREVFFSLTGRGTRSSDFIIYDLRLPRVATGLMVGFAFGLSGAIFQALIKNPLASPDVIGITSGASAFAVVAIIVFGLNGFAVSALAFLGALGTAIAMYALAWRRGVAGNRLVLVGIGLGAVLKAVIDYVMTRAQIFDAQAALIWLTGSLNGAATGDIGPLATLLAILVPLTLIAATTLTGLQLGDDTASSIGIAVERARLLLIVLAVALAAVATAAAGPVMFVAFVSGPIARRLTRGTGVALVPAGLVGAAVVCLADFAGQHLLPLSLPVGVLTAAVGAPYLLYLLVRSNRIGSGG